MTLRHMQALLCFHRDFALSGAGNDTVRWLGNATEWRAQWSYGLVEVLSMT
uniref:Uncharacterized protein n=1 Tax=Thermosporothrix sp. COM3 TaxID=2490863 RepID=A0A455SD18_9CHLR|nr:hypothetical protein KTC_01310 [Thermosporothrix sp. COM3]